MECEAPQDRHFRLAGVRDRVVRDRHRRRHGDDRPERRQRGRGPQGRPHHPRRRLQAGRAERVRARAVEDADGVRSCVPCRRHGRDREARDVPEGDQAPLAARGRQRGADLEGRPLGADPVQPQGHLRRGHHLHRHDRRRHRPGAEGQPRLHRRPGRLGVDRQGARQDVRLAARPRRHDLDPDHARDPAARVRLARRRVHPARARPDGRVRNAGPRRPAEPDRADGRVGRRGDPADRARGRRRLLAVLHPPRTRRASRRTQRNRRPRGCSSHVGPGRAHLGHHGDDRDGRDVLLRRQDVHVLRDRDDDGRRRRDDRLAHRPAGDPLVARRPGREGARPVPQPAQEGRRPGPRLGCGARRRPPPPARLRDRVDRGAARPGLPGPEPPHEPVGLRRPAEVAQGSAVVQQDPRCLPRRRHPGRRRDQGRRVRSGAAGCGRRPEEAGDRVRQGAAADLLGHLARRHGAPRRGAARRRRHRHGVERRARRRSATRSCRPPSARSPASSTRSRATRRRRRTGTTR